MLARHPFMRGWEEEVKAAVERPTFGLIYQDTENENRHIYYLLREHTRRYIKVVVDFEDQDLGIVVTAFQTSSGKSGEKLIWPESSL